jgi:CBS domain-containing protein
MMISLAIMPCPPELQMQTIHDVMTTDVKRISPEQSVRQAAQMMVEFNVGSIPVCDGDKLVGMITDRDIVVRSTSAGQSPESTRVGDVMSTGVRTCYATQSVDEVLGQMGDVQIRRVPVVDQGTHTLIGIVSLGDIATKHAAGIDHALKEISAPSGPEQR